MARTPLSEVPFCLDADIFPLCAPAEGKGGSVVLKAHPEQVQIVYAQRREELLDADTPEALEELSAIAAHGASPDRGAVTEGD